MRLNLLAFALAAALLSIAAAGCSNSSSASTAGEGALSREAVGSVNPGGAASKLPSSDSKRTAPADKSAVFSSDAAKGSSAAQPAGAGAINPLLQMTVAEPEDEAELEGDEVRVAGKTVPGAVVSIDDTVTIADEQGFFAVTLHIQESPHTIEIVASDKDGNQVGELRTVFPK